MLLQCGFDINHTDAKARSPLLHACIVNANLEVMTLLLKEGANVKQEDIEMENCL